MTVGVCWTEEQKKVIELRGCNILVSAAAGSGKTAVLVERILTMLTDPAHPTDIDRLLIVTFTNAAAGEMKDRIREAIEKKLEEEELEPKVQEHLQRQTALLQNAQITTIHSFCQYVIRNHFHTIDLDPNFRIADEGEQKLMKNDVLENFLEEKYKEGSKTFLAMSETFAAGREDKELADLVLQLYHFSMSFPWPEKWLEECKKPYEAETKEEFLSSSWIQELMELVRLTLADVLEQIEEAKKIACEFDGPYMYLEALESDAAAVKRLFQAKDYDSASALFQTGESWARLPVKKDQSVSDDKKESVKEIREQYKKAVKELKEQYFFGTADRIFGQMKQMGPMISELLDLTREFSSRFAQEKRRKNLVDFNDLEHFALKILVKEQDGRTLPTETARELAEHYEEIMIDEYQDSNLVQEMILNSVSRIEDGSYNVFMVGDVKQSIYRFRLARPELFMEKYGTYSLEEGERRRIDLHKNFRSRSQVLTAVNYVFRQIMEEHLGNVEYDQAAALYPGAVFEPAENEDFYDTEVLLVDTDGRPAKERASEKGDRQAETADSGNEEEIEETVRELEARAVGNRIREMLGREQVFDRKKSAYRPVQYGDIVILLRTVSGWAEVFARILGEMGIPANTGSRTGYFSTTEIQTILSFLKLLDNPRQDIPMAAVLYSPIVGLTGEEMAGIKSRCPDQPFYEACQGQENLRDFFEMLEELRQKAVYMPMHELLWEIYDRTGYRSYASAMPGGEQRKANLDMLVEKAIAYEEGSYRGLYHFIRYIENLHKYDVDFGEAYLNQDESSAVRIMSIHKSKGLEFPVVFVSGMGKQFNQTDARTQLVLHAGLGVGCDFVDPIRRIRNHTLFKKLIRQKTVYENLGEELRVLYVALTRAKEKLILTGTVGKLEEKLKKWGKACRRKEEALSFTQRAGASCYWDWILPSLMRNSCFSQLEDEMGLYQNRSHPLWEEEISCRIRRVGMEELLRKETDRQKELLMTREELLKLPEDEVADEKTRKLLEENFRYQYPYEETCGLPNKVSVSELKKLSQAESMEEGAALYQEPVPVPLVPDFLKAEKEVSGASRGTIYHKVMECLDFSNLAKREPKNTPGLGESIQTGAEPEKEEKKYTENTQNYDKIQKEILRMIEKGQLTEEEAELLDRRKLQLFAEHPLASRMAAAAERKQLFRERQFVMEMDAGEMNENWPSGEGVLIQGIIDAYFIEDGQIVLLDYKTDSVKLKEASSLYEKYRVQLDYYQKALERLTGLKVKEKCIYSFCLNRVLTGEVEETEERL